MRRIGTAREPKKAAGKRPKRAPTAALRRSGSRAKLVAASGTLQVTDFLSYREYLEKLYGLMKPSRKAYSYAQFAEDLGFSKTNVMWLVMSGRRKLMAKAAQRVVESLGMTGIDRQYFMTLVQYNNARRPDVREDRFKALHSLKRRDLGSDKDQNVLEYFAEWYHPVIREMTGLKDFSSEPEWIAARLSFKVLPREIRSSLELLEKLGLIRFDSDLGRHAQTGGQVLPDRKVGNMAVARYHQKMCEIAREAVTMVPEKRRDLNALTVFVTEDAAMKISQILYKACEDIMKVENECKGADQVFQVNAQLFALTKNGKRDERQGGTRGVRAP